jgi:hypothetical protein
MIVAEHPVTAVPKVRPFNEKEALARFGRALTLANAPLRFKGPSLIKVSGSVVQDILRSYWSTIKMR